MTRALSGIIPKIITISSKTIFIIGKLGGTFRKFYVLRTAETIGANSFSSMRNSGHTSDIIHSLPVTISRIMKARLHPKTKIAIIISVDWGIGFYSKMNLGINGIAHHIFIGSGIEIAIFKTPVM